MKFNEKIKALRKAANMNQQELANKINIHVTHLSKMENGHLLPSIDIVQRLMKVFAVSADNLLNDSENSVVELENHELSEQLMLINQLDDEEKDAEYQNINDETLKRMQNIEKLTAEDKSHVYAMLDAFFAKSKLQSLLL